MNTPMSLKNVADVFWMLGAPLGTIALVFALGARLG